VSRGIVFCVTMACVIGCLKLRPRYNEQTNLNSTGFIVSYRSLRRRKLLYLDKWLQSNRPNEPYRGARSNCRLADDLLSTLFV